MRTGRPVPESPLGSVGVAARDERVYRYLVRAGGLRSAEQIPAALELSPRTAAGILRSLRRQALVDRSDSRPPGYSASPPELALEPLMARQRDDLARTRVYAQELQRVFTRAAASHTGSDLVELIVGPQRVMAYLQHQFYAVRTRFDALTKQWCGDDLRAAQSGAADRGVRGQAVYETFVEPAHLATGVQARTTGELPVELTLFDRCVGILAMGVDCAAIVRASPMLDVLTALFDRTWSHAVPVLSTMDGPVAEDIDERSRQVLLLMSDGLKDESIARALGLSRRTVQKCVTGAMASLGARTRFQAALLAHDRGWLS